MRDLIDIVENTQRTAGMLTELFDRVLDWKWLSNEEREEAGEAGLFDIVARFSVPGFPHPYYMCFEDYRDIGDRGYSLFFGYDDDQYGIRTFPEKTGTAFSVYPTIIDIIEDFLAVYGPNALRMKGTFGKQTQLYHKIAQKLLPRLPGWTIRDTHDGVILAREEQLSR